MHLYKSTSRATRLANSYLNHCAIARKNALNRLIETQIGIRHDLRYNNKHFALQRHTRRTNFISTHETTRKEILWEEEKGTHAWHVGTRLYRPSRNQCKHTFHCAYGSRIIAGHDRQSQWCRWAFLYLVIFRQPSRRKYTMTLCTGTTRKSNFIHIGM
jgi:hypothetical protein